MSINQMEAQYTASRASNDAKSGRCVQEAEEKAEAAGKQRKDTWVGSNLVSCCVDIMHFYFSDFKFSFTQQGTQIFDNIGNSNVQEGEGMSSGSSHYQETPLPAGLT